MTTVLSSRLASAPRRGQSSDCAKFDDLILDLPRSSRALYKNPVSAYLHSVVNTDGVQTLLSSE